MLMVPVMRSVPAKHRCSPLAVHNQSDRFSSNGFYFAQVFEWHLVVRFHAHKLHCTLFSFVSFTLVKFLLRLLSSCVESICLFVNTDCSGPFVLVARTVQMSEFNRMERSRHIRTMYAGSDAHAQGGRETKKKTPLGNDCERNECEFGDSMIAICFQMRCDAPNRFTRTFPAPLLMGTWHQARPSISNVFVWFRIYFDFLFRARGRCLFVINQFLFIRLLLLLWLTVEMWLGLLIAHKHKHSLAFTHDCTISRALRMRKIQIIRIIRITRDEHGKFGLFMILYCVVIAVPRWANGICMSSAQFINATRLVDFFAFFFFFFFCRMKQRTTQ